MSSRERAQNLVNVLNGFCFSFFKEKIEIRKCLRDRFLEKLMRRANIEKENEIEH